jgi:Mrp family chromosome partitioning ATPase
VNGVPLLDRRLVVLAGKGGVGRTTVAAALARLAARQGKRVLLCQTRSKERLSRLFGSRPVGSSIVSIGERLWAVNIQPEAAIREYGTMVLHSAFVARQVLDNRFSRGFLHAIPGFDDYAMLGKVWFHTTEEENGKPRWDLVILDGPATGHVINLLRVPASILRAVPEGPLTRTARGADELLRDPLRSAMVVVTLAEEMPTTEAIELVRTARALIGIDVPGIVFNQLYPARFRQAAVQNAVVDLSKSSHGPAIDAMLARARLAIMRRQVNELHLELVRRELELPCIELPFVFAEDFGPAALDVLAAELEARLGLNAPSLRQAG